MLLKHTFLEICVISYIQIIKNFLISEEIRLKNNCLSFILYLMMNIFNILQP